MAACAASNISAYKRSDASAGSTVIDARAAYCSVSISGTTIRIAWRRQSSSKAGTYAASVTRGTSSAASAACSAGACPRRSHAMTGPRRQRRASARWNSWTRATRRPALVRRIGKELSVMANSRGLGTGLERPLRAPRDEGAGTRPRGRSTVAPTPRPATENRRSEGRREARDLRGVDARVNRRRHRGRQRPAARGNGRHADRMCANHGSGSSRRGVGGPPSRRRALRAWHAGRRTHRSG